MRPEPDDLQTLISKYRTMNIEELKANIKYWEEYNDNYYQLKSLDIAKTELERKYKERQEQIKILSKSLTSSSRVGRWISSIRIIIKQFVEIKN